jgi:hypothetical protein
VQETPHRKPLPPRTSSLLRDFLERFEGPRICLQDLVDALGHRGFGLLLVVFALPTLIPIPFPGIVILFDIPLIVLSAQIAAGRHLPWFPRWLGRQSVSHEHFAAVLERALPVLERAERLFHPRLSILLEGMGMQLAGFALLVIALVLAVPIPLWNWLPALSVTTIGLALMARDGTALLVGLGIGAISLAVAMAAIWGLFRGLQWLLPFGA